MYFLYNLFYKWETSRRTKLANIINKLTKLKIKSILTFKSFEVGVEISTTPNWRTWVEGTENASFNGTYSNDPKHGERGEIRIFRLEHLAAA